MFKRLFAIILGLALWVSEIGGVVHAEDISVLNKWTKLENSNVYSYIIEVEPNKYIEYRCLGEPTGTGENKLITVFFYSTDWRTFKPIGTFIVHKDTLIVNDFTKK